MNKTLRRNLSFVVIVTAFLSIAALQANAAIYFTETFDGSWTNCPANWSYSNAGAYWQSGNGNYHYPCGGPSPTQGTNFAFFYAYNFYYVGCTITTPTINMSAATQGRIGFDWYRGSGGSSYMNISVSSDNGGTWLQIGSLNDGSCAWDRWYFSVPSAYWTSQVKFQFYAYSDWYYDFSMDNMIVDDGTVPIRYCGAGSYSDYYAGIYWVGFNTISNYSSYYGTGGYSNYTSLNTNVVMGNSYTLQVTQQTYYGYDSYTYAWIDWDQNGVFNTTNEQYYLGDLYYSTGSVVVTVPTNAPIGPTRMRIRTQAYFNGSPGPCGSIYGETEDYTVTVSCTNRLTLTPLTMKFEGETNNPVLPTAQTATLTTPAAFAWNTTVTSMTPPWLTCTPATGTGSATPSIGISRTNLTPGTYTGSVLFKGGDACPVTDAVTYVVYPQVQIATSSNPAIILFGCGLYGGTSTDKSVMITNPGGHYSLPPQGRGYLQWTATTTAPEITIQNSTGKEGENLNFKVNATGLPAGVTTRTIVITGYNGLTNVPASNTPYVLIVQIVVENPTPASLTLPLPANVNTIYNNVGGTPFAEVKTSAAVASFTVNMTPCQDPPGLTRIRYNRRWYTFSSSATSGTYDITMYYSINELYPYVTNPAKLQVYQQPRLNGTWVNLSVSKATTVNTALQTVKIVGVNNLTGRFAMAHAWAPKTMNFNLTSAMYDRSSRNVVLQWSSDVKPNSEGFYIERAKDAENPEWQMAGSVDANAFGEYGFSDKIVEEGTYLYRVFGVDDEGTAYESQPVSVNVSTLPGQFSLEQNYPNPFNPSTSIRFNVPQTTNVTLKVYDMFWREVATLVNESKSAGTYNVSFDASKLASGTYFYRMDADNFTMTRKLNVMK
jgi:hypothetical protein